MAAPVIQAQPFWGSQNVLGEGILWDSDAKVLRWVDIKVAEVHSLDPVTKRYTVDTYPETQFVNALMLRKNKEDDAVAVFSISTPDSSSPTTPGSVKKTEQKVKKVIAKPLTDYSAEGIEMRFNDGGCDPSGRLFAGSTHHSPNGEGKGEFVRVETDGSYTKIFDGVHTSNGLGWSPDAKTMYYIDSGHNEIRAFDYDITTGTLSNKRIFAPAPEPVDPNGKSQGVYDGMTIDGQGNIWVARWKDSRVMGFRPDGSLIANIITPGCLLTTIPCFGGENLDQMYIASANTKWAREGDIQSKFPHSGDIYVVDFGPGSEIRKILGEDWKGAERHRFAA